MTKSPEDAIPWLKIMLCQLRRERLTVELATSVENNSGVYRVVTNENPKWYRELCASHPSRRKHNRARNTQTRVSRKRIITALETLTQCQYTRSTFAKELIEIAYELRDAEEEERIEYEEKYGKAGVGS